MFTDCYGTQFRRSANALSLVYDDALRAVGLKLTQFSLLRALERLGASSFTDIALEVALDKTTISRNLAILIKAGWVDVAGGGDARFKMASISQEGVRLLQRAEPHWALAQEKIEGEMQRFLTGPARSHLLQALESVQELGRVARP